MARDTLVSVWVGHRGRSECNGEEMEGWNGVEEDDDDRENDDVDW